VPCARALAAIGVALTAVSLGACTERVNVSSDEVQANDAGFDPSISRDGRYVTFYSGATNLVPSDTQPDGDVFLRDRVAGVTTLVSTGTSGASGLQQISANGRYVAFQSSERLTADDTGFDDDVFVWDRETGALTRASVGAGGDEGNANSFVPLNFTDLAISRNGRYVAFASSDENLVPGDGNRLEDIFVRDRVAGTTVRIPTESTGEPTTASDNTTLVGIIHPAISLDGRYVGFASARATLFGGGGLLREVSDLYVRDMQTGITTRLTDGAERAAAELDMALDGDGTHAAFSALGDILVRKLGSGAVTRVPASLTATPDDELESPSLNRSGRFLAFAGRSPTAASVYVYDLQTGDLKRRADGDSPRLSADGAWLTWVSGSSNLVKGDTNGVADVFVSPARPSR
jgi:Tol biopolymer transport system component